MRIFLQERSVFSIAVLRRILTDTGKMNPEHRKHFLIMNGGTVGDMARMDDDGFIYLVDRAKDMIVSGGTNIYPAEVEGVILQMEGIADAGVIGVPDEKWGELVKAVVVVKKGSTVTEEQIISFCKERPCGDSRYQNL